mmetsp:Transcript_16569/g.37389  ORF Transcript_16569/g.37389 Transcript_16569/m.37389 type:complete len:508 (-) Transcript_16569:119-1642(-)
MRSSVLLALAGVVGGAADDVSALVQAQVQRHSNQHVTLHGFQKAINDASQSMSQRLLESLMSAPKLAKGSDGGVSFKRTEHKAEEGSSMKLKVSGGCATDDEGGSNDCIIPWGTAVNISYSAVLKGGLKKGDKVVFNLAARWIAANQSDPMSKIFTGTALATGGSCDICEGSCVSSTAADNGTFLLDVSSPTNIANETFCSGLSTTEKLDIPESTITFPAPPNAWQLSAEAMVQMEILSKDGTVRVSESTTYNIAPGSAVEPSAMMAKPLIPTSLAAAMETSLRQVAPAMLKQGHHSDTVAAYKKLAPKGKGKKGKKINAMVWKIRMGDIEKDSGKNFTLVSDSGCTKVDNMGSVDCIFEFTKASDVKIGLNMEYTADEGSYAIIRNAPKVGGMLGMMVNAMLKPTSFRVPLCGKGQIKLSDAMPPIDVDSGLCGFHSVSLTAPAFIVDIPDLADMSLKMEGVPSMPMMPATFGELPPTTVEMDVQMFHADGSRIGTYNTTMGIGYA